MPLPEDAGKAIADYIRHGRREASRKPFVSSQVPFPPFVGAPILSVTLREASKCTELAGIESQGLLQFEVSQI